MFSHTHTQIHNVNSLLKKKKKTGTQRVKLQYHDNHFTIALDIVMIINVVY